MIVDRGGRLVGLESEDHSVRLVGAAYAHPRLAGWVIPGERAAFIEKVNEISRAGDRTHTGGTISADSAGVTTDIEAQRDRVPVANEVVAARDYKLPRAVSADRLALPMDHVDSWPARLEDFLTASLRARRGRLEVVPQRSGREGVHLYRVNNGGEDVGLLRVYDTETLAQQEAAVAARIHAAAPSLDVAIDRGSVEVPGGSHAALASHPREANGARGTRYEDLVEAWTHADDAGRAAAYQRLEAAVTATARTFAQVHSNTGSGGMMSNAAKQRLIIDAYAQLEAPDVVAALGSIQAGRVRARVESLAQAFMASRVPSTMTLGRADADAFSYRDFRVEHAAVTGTSGEKATFGRMSAEDIGGGGPSSSSGAADIAQYLESLRSDSRVSGIVARLEEQFMKTYRSSSAVVFDLDAAVAWFGVSFALRQIARHEPGAAARLTARSSDPWTR
ncbi:MAG: hypothetical protein ABI678_10130 [Kofleriaceae bacterium]